MLRPIIFFTTIIFIVSLCGAVSAQDSDINLLKVSDHEITDGTNLNQKVDTQNNKKMDPHIYGVVKEIYDEKTKTYTNLTNAKPVKGAIVKVRNPTNNAVIATATTNKNGAYDLNFISGLNKFTLEIAFSTYKPYRCTVSPSGVTPYSKVNHTFMPDIAIISSAAEKGKGIQDLNNRRLIYLDMWNSNSSPANDWIMEYVNFAYLDMAMPGTGWGDSWYDELLRSPANQNYKIASAFGYPSCDTDTDIYGGDGLHLLKGHDTSDTAETLQNTYIGSYYALATGQALHTNLQNMAEYIYFLLGEKSRDPTENGKSPVMDTPDWGIYHKDYPGKTISAVASPAQIKKWIKTNPGYIAPYFSLKWIDQDYAKWASKTRSNIYRTFEKWYTSKKPKIKGPFIVITSYGPGGVTAPAIDAMITEYEKKGRAVLNLYQGATNPPISSLLEELTLGKGGIGPLSRGISAVTSLYSWSLNYDNLMGGDGALTELERMNIKAIKAVQLYSQTSMDNPLGAQYEWTFAVTFPSFEGVFSPVVISYSDDNYTEHPLYAGIKKIVSLTNQWAKLKEIPNSQKKIAVILYNYPPGKAEMGASYLDVFKSTHDLLIRLKKEGYDVGTYIPSPQKLYTLLSEGGNKGTWAQPLLEKYVSENEALLRRNRQLVDKKTYLGWFNELPQKLREEAIKKWGNPLGNIMVHNHQEILIPGIMLGNVFITLQPSRGWEEVEDYHDPYLPPHHQYIAFYKWLEKNFKANAMIHMGTHGTLEFLPGRQVGLQEDDWPFQLTNLPNLNPYIVSNPGEGLVAKDRTGTLIIDHMTPAMVKSGLYGDLIVIHDLIHQYENAVKVGNNQILSALQAQILSRAKGLGLPVKKNQKFGTWLEEIHLKLHEIENDIIPLGIHSLGKVLSGDELVEEIFTISSSMTNILEHTKTMLFPSLVLGYYDLQQKSEYQDKIRCIDARVKAYILKIANGKDYSKLVVNNKDLLADLKFCQEIISKIRSNQEWNSIINALDGGFVKSGLGADPAYADVLPTGMNFYGANPKKMPTTAAWETGKKIADKLLTDYYLKHGKFPETIGMVMWGTELLRTDAIALAEFMYLLGVKPVWNSNGDVQPIPELIKLADLKINIKGVIMNRPRIDVLVTAVTGNDIWINLMNNSVKLASEAEGETTRQNYIKKHYAEHRSLDRVFGLRGLVLEGTGISDLVPNTKKWTSTDELASVYLSRVSYAWKTTNNGVNISQNKATFQYLLRNMDLATQNLDSTWRLLDTDDYYDWYGGMMLASRNLGGNPDSLLADIRNKNNVVTRSMQEETELEIRSQLLNPVYQDSLLKSPSGWLEYASRYENIFGIQATTGCISSQMWTLAAQNLLDAKFTSSSDYSAFATQSMLGWTIEAARRNMWKPDAQLLTTLKDKYITSVNAYGVSCCHHTCGNLDFNQYMVMGSSLSTAELTKFSGIFNAATGQNIDVGEKETAVNAQNGNGGSSGEATDQNGIQSSSQRLSSDNNRVMETSVGEQQVSNEKTVYEVSKKGQNSGGQSSMPIVAIMGVILLLGLFGFGYIYRGKFR